MRYLIFVFCCIEFNAFSQTFFTKQFNLAEGLPQSFVTSIDQDPNGYLWVGTAAGGLSRFDGASFENFGIDAGLPSLSIIDIEVFANRLWVSTTKGLLYFDGEKFIQISVPHSIKNKNIRKLVSFKGFLFLFVEGNHIWKLSASASFIHFYSLEAKHGIVTDIIKVKNELWFTTHTNFILKLSEDSVIIQKTKSKMLLSVLEYSKDSIYVCDDKSFYQSDLQFKSKINFTIPDSINRVRKVFRLNDNLFLLTDKGILLFANNRIQAIKTNLNLSNKILTSFFQDTEGNGWIGTNYDGLIKINLATVKKVNINGVEFKGLIIDMLRLKDESIIISEYKKGNFIVSDNKVKKINLPLEYVINLASLGDTILFITQLQELHLFYKNKIISKPDFLETIKRPSFIIEKFNDSLLVTDSENIFLIKQNSCTVFATIPNAISYLKIGRKEFIGTYNGIEILKNKVSKKITTKSELDKVPIISLYKLTDSTFLAGTEGLGLWSLKIKNENLQIQDRTFINERITFITKGKHTYIGTHTGIKLIQIDNEGKIKSLLNLGSDNGFTGIESVENNYLFHPIFGLLIGSVNGLFQINEDDIKYGTSVPNFKITKITGKNLPETKGSWFQLPINQTWPYHVSDIQFSFKAVSLSSPQEYEYYYQLPGVINEWTKLGKKNFLSFPTLSSGEYHLKLKAKHIHEPITTTLTYTFSIEKPWWRTNFFFLGIFIVLTIITLSIIQYRVNRYKSYQHALDQSNKLMRKELAKDFHDELGNHLASIIAVLQVVKAKYVSLPDELKYSFSKLEKHATNLFFGTKDFIASIDPEHETLAWAIEYLKDFGDNLFKDTDQIFDCSKIEDWAYRIKVKSFYSRNIILIFKEAMTNALKHSEASRISFIIEKEKNVLKIVLTDNGKGLKEIESRIDASGFQNMKHRAQKIKAEIKIESLSEGTNIILYKGNFYEWGK